MAVSGLVVLAAGYVVLSLLSDDSGKNNKSVSPTKKQIREQRELEGTNRCDRKNIQLEKEYDNYLFLHNNTSLISYDFNFYNRIIKYSFPQFQFNEVPICENNIYFLKYDPLKKHKFSIFNLSKNKNIEIDKLNSKNESIYTRLNKQKKLFNEFNYQFDLCAYERKKYIEYDKFIKNEELKKTKIETDNDFYNKLKINCSNGDENYLSTYFKFILNEATFCKNIGLINFSCNYNSNIKRLYIDLIVANKEDLFYLDGYKYIKSKDEIRKINIKSGHQNELYKQFLVSISIAVANILAKNDKFNSLNDIVVNCSNSGLCKSSFYMLKEDLTKKHVDFDDLSDENVRCYKSFNRAVVPFDNYYISINII